MSLNKFVSFKINFWLTEIWVKNIIYAYAAGVEIDSTDYSELEDIVEEMVLANLNVRYGDTFDFSFENCEVIKQKSCAIPQSPNC